MSDKKARIGWIDEFKGFVLLLVCLYHVEQSFPQAQMGMLHLSALRMSAFFFISGMLFSTRRFDNFKSYLVHKTRVLLVPYILLSLLFLALDPVIYNFDLFPKAPRMTIMNIRPEIATVWDYIYWNLAKIFVAGKSSIGSGPLWFVFTLYSVSLIFYGVQKIVPRKFIFFISLASLAGGWLLYINHIRLPLGIERDLTVLFFFANGWLCKGALKDSRLRGDDPRAKSTLAIVVATVLAFAAYAYIEIPDNPSSALDIVFTCEKDVTPVAFVTSYLQNADGKLFIERDSLNMIPGVKNGGQTAAPGGSTDSTRDSAGGTGDGRP